MPVKSPAMSKFVRCSIFLTKFLKIKAAISTQINQLMELSMIKINMCKIAPISCCFTFLRRSTKRYTGIKTQTVNNTKLAITGSILFPTLNKNDSTRNCFQINALYFFQKLV